MHIFGEIIDIIKQSMDKLMNKIPNYSSANS